MALKLEKLSSEMEKYILQLTDEEMSKNTIKNYSLSIRKFIAYTKENLNDNAITKGFVIEYKQHLQELHKPQSTNLYIVALNKYLKYLKASALCVKPVSIQSRNSLENSITLDEYEKMLSHAKALNKNDIYYIMRTIANTGIRVSELEFITVESIKARQCTITNKQRIRDIVISEMICKELLDFCEIKNIEKGYLFFGRNPNVVIREETVLRRMKRVANKAGIDEKKAYPHNFRHFFAKIYMEKHNDAVELADVLGHKSLETTRIYTRTTNAEKRIKLKNLGL